MFGGKKPPLLTDDEVGEVLQKAQTLKKWVTDIEKYALSALLQGKDITGFKAVEGRSNRKFEDVDKAFEAVKQSGIDEALLYERKPITLTALQKLMGKAQFDKVLDGFIVKPPGKPTLVPISDKREAITAQTSAKDAFSDK